MPAKIFFCYAHEDELLLNKLKTHLRPLERQALIDLWYDRNISAGTVWEEDIKKHLNEADIILLLISPSFIDSDYCYSIELKRAIERHKEGNVRVIPIILEYVYWQFEPLSKLQALPVDAKPITSWQNQNEALYNVAESIRKVVNELTFKSIYSLQETLIQPKKEEQRFANVPQQNIAKPEDFFLQRRISASKITSVAFSANSQLLTCVSNHTAITLWNPYTGAFIRTFTGHSNGIISVAFSPDTKQLASGSYDNSIKLWDPYTGTLLRTLSGHSGTVYSVTFSPNNQFLASGSGSADNSIKLWNPYTGTLLRTLSGHSEKIISLAFSPDSQLLASGSHDSSIKLWNPYTGTLLRTLSGHLDMVQSVVINNDNQLLASGSSDNSIKLWNPHTGTLLRTLSGHSSVARSVAFSPDNQLLASGNYDSSIKLWNPYTGTLLRTLSGHSKEIISIAFSYNGQLLASGDVSNDNAIIIWGKKSDTR